MKGFTVTAPTARTVVEVGCEDKVTQAEDSGQSLRSCPLRARSVSHRSWGQGISCPRGVVEVRGATSESRRLGTRDAVTLPLGMEPSLGMISGRDVDG